MAVKIMSLRMALDDEVSEMMSLLEENNIDCYHTPEGSFGVSAAALWLHDETQFLQAEELIAGYQSVRAKKAEGLYEQAKQKGEQQTLGHKFAENPMAFILSILGIIFFAYILFVPILDLIK